MVEVQGIFQQHGEQYRKAHKLTLVQHKAMSAIGRCRTGELGAHVDVCENCGDTQISYNSCRNRHCPKCQMLSKERWIENRKSDLLNVGYFHVVFTLPSELRPVLYQNQAVSYNVLFRAVAQTLQELAGKAKFLGARLGFTSILHTWGQNLSYHPHIHCIIPGGGLDSLGKWRDSRKKFFIPVKVLSRLFRGKFLDALRHAALSFHGELKFLENLADWNRLLDCCYRKQWVVYCKPPFRDAACVVEYLGRYTHRVAISNNRILKFENGKVSFKWWDYKDGNRWKVMTVAATEFIRRFLMHVLPPRFTKIRHYGLLSSRDKGERLLLCKQLTKTPILPKTLLTTAELIQKLTGRDPSKCPACGYEKTRLYGLSPPIPV